MAMTIEPIKAKYDGHFFGSIQVFGNNGKILNIDRTNFNYFITNGNDLFMYDSMGNMKRCFASNLDENKAKILIKDCSAAFYDQNARLIDGTAYLSNIVYQISAFNDDKTILRFNVLVHSLIDNSQDQLLEVLKSFRENAIIGITKLDKSVTDYKVLVGKRRHIMAHLKSLDKLGKKF